MSCCRVNSLFSCFADSPSSPDWGDSLKAFIFSLKNSEGLPPFKCFAENKYKAIYKSSADGPTFGKHQYTGIKIYSGDSDRMAKALARIYEPYSVPAEVNNKHKVLAGVDGIFSPDNCEVFYLA